MPKLEVDVALSDEDVSRIADAVVVAIAKAGATINGQTPNTGGGDKPAGDKPKTTNGKGNTNKVDPKLRDNVLAKLREASAAKGRPAAVEVLSKYAADFKDVKDADLQALLDDLDALLKAEPESSEDEAGGGF